MSQGIEERHGTKCPKRGNKSGRCNRRGCSYRAMVYNRALGTTKNIEWSPRFRSLDEAKTWRVNRQKELAQGIRATKSTLTLKQAWDQWYADAEKGALLTRSGERYKPKTLRSYQGTMKLYVIPKHGSVALTSVSRDGLQKLVKRMQSDGRAPATVRNTINALRALFRDSDHFVQGGIAPDPTDGLRLPAVRQKPKRKVTVKEASKLLGALRESDRPVWATFFYSGLRVGEVLALRWQDIDFKKDEIHVEQGWDSVDGAIEPKSSAGRRIVPMPAVLKAYLKTQQATQPKRKPSDLVFGKDGKPFSAPSYRHRANKAWEKAKLDPITPHECRHAYAALMIAAGTSMSALSEYMGHSGIQVTIDTYSYLLDGTRRADARKLNKLLTA